MEKRIKVILLAFCFPAMTWAASDTVVTIRANLVAQPCTVSTDSLTFDLGDIDPATLEAATSASPWSATKSINLTNCPNATTKVNALFTGVISSKDPLGYQNGGTGDPSVSIQLGNPDKSYALIPSVSRYGDVTVQADHTASFPLAVRLFSTNGNATPGLVSGTVNVSFTYK